MTTLPKCLLLPSLLLPSLIIAINLPLHVAVADEFDDWLDQLSKAGAEAYARELNKTIQAWINRGEEQVANANLNLIILRRAGELSTRAITNNSKQQKITLIKESLAKLGDMEDIVALKTFLIVRVIPSPPGSKAISLGMFLLKAAGSEMLNSSERNEIRGLLQEGTRQSFNQAKRKISAAERRIFEEQ